jgi:hypothetical protein
MTDDDTWAPLALTADVSLPPDADPVEVAQALADGLPDTSWEMWAEVAPLGGTPQDTPPRPTTYLAQLHVGRSLQHPDVHSLVQIIARSWERTVHDMFGDDAMLGVVDAVEEAPAGASLGTRRTSGH